MRSSDALDNPVWHALEGEHAALAQRHGQAMRYHADVASLAALSVASTAAFADLAAIVPLGETVTLITSAPLAAAAGWQSVQTDMLDQMLCPRLDSQSTIQTTRLGQADVPAMLDLADRTAPGLFYRAALQMGRYQGICLKADGTLRAMAGERLRLHKFTEISAVCTDPAHRGHGYASALVTDLVSRIFERGESPFLHVRSGTGMGRIYERLGFRFRRLMSQSIIRRA